MNIKLLATALVVMNTLAARDSANRIEEVEPEPAPPPPPPPPAEPECVSIFRVQTCEDGVLHMLGPNMEWLN